MEVLAGDSADNTAEPTDKVPITIGSIFPLLTNPMGASLRSLNLSDVMRSETWNDLVSRFEDLAEDLADYKYGELVPPLAVWKWLKIDEPDPSDLRCSPLRRRSRNVLLQNQVRTWGEVSKLTLRNVNSFTNAGIGTVKDILRFAVELGAFGAIRHPEGSFQAEPAGPAAMAPQPLGDDETARHFSELAMWAIEETDALTLGEALDRASSSISIPPDIRDAVSGIRSTLLPRFTTETTSSANLLSGILHNLLPNDVKVILRRRLTDAPQTLEELGHELGVTRERVRQIQVRAEERFDALLSERSSRAVIWRGYSLRGALGSCAPCEDPRVKSALEFAVRGETEYPDALRHLVLSIAGPYRVEGQVLVTGIAAHDVGARLRSHADGFGVIDASVASSTLTDFGIREEFQQSALDWVGGFRQWNGTLLVWPHSGVDKAVTVLALRGAPATMEEIIADIGEEYSERSLHQRIMDDPRVTRINRHQFALSAWGYDEYSSIADAIADQIARDGGSSDLTSLVSTIASTFQVKESSVRIYAEAPMFVITDGRVRLRGTDEFVTVDEDVSKARGTFKVSADCYVTLIDVDHDILRGSGRAIPKALSLALGVAPGSKRTFKGGQGNVVVSWPRTSATGPAFGSTRMCAIETRCQEGQLMRLTFDTTMETVSASAIPPSILKGSLPSAEAVETLCGIDLSESKDPIEAVAVAIGVGRSAVRRTLAARGDEDVLRVLPIDEADEEFDAALERLAQQLGETG